MSFDDELTDNEELSYGHYIPKVDTLYGKCTLQIRFNDKYEYLRWRKYNGGKTRWDFMTQYPAIMTNEFEFHTSQDIDMLVRQIVQLLQQGYNVRAVDWKLTEYESQLDKNI